MIYALIIPGNIAEIFILYYFWFSNLTLRYSKPKSALIFFSVQILNLIKCLMMLGAEQVLLKSLTSTLVFLLLMQLLFSDKWYKKLVVYGTYMVCVTLAETCSMLFAKYVYNNDALDPTLPSFSTFLWQATAYLFLFIISIIAYLLLKNKRINPESRVTQFVYLYIASQCLLVFMFVLFVYEYRITSPIMLAVIAVVLVISVGLGFIITLSIRYAVRTNAEAEFIKKEAAMKDRHFTELREQYTEYRRLRHDFINHIKIIYKLDDAEKLKAYIASLKGKFDKLDSASYCNNLTLDALLCVKKSEASQLGIATEYSVCDTVGITVTDFDLCTVVSNLLDNAITAAAATEQKYVSLTITKKLGRLVIIVKNSSPPVDASLKTIKADADNHGLGVKIIKKTAAKYDGDAVFKYENGEFISIITLNC